MNATDWIKILTDLSQIFATLITSFGVFYSAWRWMIRPIKNHIDSVSKHFQEFDGLTKTVKALDEKMNDTILPVINAVGSEFVKNGGNSIKERIQRIDDMVTLSELRSKMIASNFLTVGAFERDTNGDTTWVNKAICEMFGLTEEEMMGNGWLSGVAEKERADVWRKWIDHIENNIPYEDEFTVRNHKTGERFRVRVVASTHRTNDHKILGYYGTIVRV